MVFVDTNIMLDFYRLPGEAADRQIAALLKHLDSIIVTEQVKMEFMKNRQKVILESIKKLSFPNFESTPMIVSGNKYSSAFDKKISEAKSLHKKIKEKVSKILKDPATHDPVFKGLKKLFSKDSPYNLKRPDKKRFLIRNLARKRFALGYPPRKPSDNSIGDALNWEWIIHCAQASQGNPNILIVSRDTDYGIVYDKDAILNDWLKEEFKKRVSQKRKIRLTNRLTEALKLLEENVADEDEKAEDDLIDDFFSSLTSTRYPVIEPFKVLRGRYIDDSQLGGPD
ncbi:Uncharacterized protein apha_03169 [Umezakia ovalisporum]|nr:Uncharacterized protein apha_03169 [Umezakia ovalisporum]